MSWITLCHLCMLQQNKVTFKTGNFTFLLMFNLPYKKQIYKSGSRILFRKVTWYFLSNIFLSNLEGNLFLKNGRLSGLSCLERTVPSKFEIRSGLMELRAGFGVSNLSCPFQPSTSLEISKNFNPEVAAVVEKVGLLFELKIPITGGESFVGEWFNFLTHESLFKLL